IDYIATEMIKSRQAYQDKTEDELTISIVVCLKAMGFQASHDTQYGGHPDIVVEARDGFLWLAEAKKYRNSYEWLSGGMKQLLTRYGDGLAGQDAGDLLIYCYLPGTDTIIAGWENRLREIYPSAPVTRCNRDDQVIRSAHPVDTTGRDFRVRHKTISLYFN